MALACRPPSVVEGLLEWTPPAKPPYAPFVTVYYLMIFLRESMGIGNSVSKNCYFSLSAISPSNIYLRCSTFLACSSSILCNYFYSFSFYSCSRFYYFMACLCSSLLSLFLSLRASLASAWCSRAAICCISWASLSCLFASFFAIAFARPFK